MQRGGRRRLDRHTANVNATSEEPSVQARLPLRAYVTSTLFWSYLAASCPPWFVGAALTWAATLPFDRRRKLLHLYTSAWAYHYVKLLPLWRTHFEGTEHIRPGKRYVLVANHQSLGDILVLFGLFKPYKWVSKREIFALPFIGWNMRLNDYVGLVRGDAASIERMLAECRRHLQNGSSVLLFPEGTRSVDGELKRFKHGAFTLAKELGVEIIPIVVDGTRDALPKQGLLLKQRTPLDIQVRVLEPIVPRSDESVAELSERVRQVMVERLHELRREHRARELGVATGA
jgi:1-acyl-sn-glycerol-3-phosphate acyltransferase